MLSAIIQSKKEKKNTKKKYIGIVWENLARSCYKKIDKLTVAENT